jgi:hypothetical protein
MFQEFLSRSELLRLPLIGMVLCFAAFIGILVRQYIGFKHGESVDHLASLPLDDDRSAGGSTQTGRTSIL